MSEPEDIILDGAHHATLFVRRLWGRRSGVHRPDTVRLRDVRARLELFVRAAFGAALTVGPAEAPPIPSLFTRLGRRIPRHLVERRTLPCTDGIRIRLPAEIPVDAGGLNAYRLLAAQMATRAVRGTARCLPSDLLVRDLYLIAEARAVDALLGTELPGLLPRLRGMRTQALSVRPPLNLLSPIEAAVEKELQLLLKAIVTGGDVQAPVASIRWAQATATTLGSVGGRYRGLPAVAYWGSVDAPAERPIRRAVGSPNEEAPPAQFRIGKMPRRPRVRYAPEDEDDDRVGLWMVQLDDPQEHVEDPMGLQRPTDRDADADADDLADSLSELPEARLIARPGRPREILASDEPPPTGVADCVPTGKRSGFAYPEWDYRSGSYREPGALVRERTPILGDPAWAERVLTRRAALLQEVRRRFERLRPRRLRVGRQLDGAEVDIAAYVNAHADRRAGCAADDRLYEAVRPARRDVAITLLVDVSGSTDSWVTEDLRVVDVEKEALLVVCDALEALGDPYSILAFSGEGPEDVCVLPIKAFEEGTGSVIRRRIAALEPDRYTRMGAAIRHATAVLARKSARHRLLLVLSDGKPNDVDRYEGRYGVEDARQSVVEARLQGMHPFCVTVDRHAPAYMPRIFGAGGYAGLHHPEHLPSVLVDVLRRLVKG